MPAPGTPYTAAEIQRAVALQAKGHTWAQVASILGRNRGSLKVTVCMWRKAHAAARRQRDQASQRINDALVHAVTIEGVTAGKVLSHRIGLSLSATHRRLIRLGLDARSRQIAARAAKARPLAGPADRHPPTSGAAA